MEEYDFLDKTYYKEISPFVGRRDCVVNIPFTVKYISYSALCEYKGMLSDEQDNNYFSIVKINVDKQNPYYCSEDGILFTKNKDKLLHLSLENDIFDKNNEYAIPNSVDSFSPLNGFPVFGSRVSFVFGKKIKQIDTYMYDDTGTDAIDNISTLDEPNWVIKGYKGTVAEEWAEKYNLKFVPLD